MKIKTTHHTLANGEECLYLIITVSSDLGEIELRNFQYFRRALVNPKYKDKRGNYWDTVIPLDRTFNRDICYKLYTDGLHRQYPKIDWDDRFISGVF